MLYVYLLLATTRYNYFITIIFINFMHAFLIIVHVQLCMLIVCSCCTGHYSDIEFYLANFKS